MAQESDNTTAVDGGGRQEVRPDWAFLATNLPR